MGLNVDWRVRGGGSGPLPVVGPALGPSLAPPPVATEPAAEAEADG